MVADLQQELVRKEEELVRKEEEFVAPQVQLSLPSMEEPFVAEEVELELPAYVRVAVDSIPSGEGNLDVFGFATVLHMFC